MWGGVPAYWERLDPNLSVMENLRQQLLPANSLILDEPRLLLQDFINDPYNYVGIMRAIAGGAQSSSAISDRTGLLAGPTSKYLSILRAWGFCGAGSPCNGCSGHIALWPLLYNRPLPPLFLPVSFSLSIENCSWRATAGTELLLIRVCPNLLKLIRGGRFARSGCYGQVREMLFRLILNM